LKALLDPVEIALANAPVDDEPLTAEEIKALDESSEWLKHTQGIPQPMRSSVLLVMLGETGIPGLPQTARPPPKRRPAAGSHLFNRRGFDDELFYESDGTQDDKNICESYRQRTDCGKPPMRPVNKK